jgi:hypothetical protein
MKNVASFPPWALMWALAVLIFCFCKTITWSCARKDRAPAWRHAAYLFAWPGLDAGAFLFESPENLPDSREWFAAAAKTALGAVLFWFVARLIPSEHELLYGWTGMLGLIFMLHFGSFHLLSCFWRRLGANARPLMNLPLFSQSLSEFWGRRWNTAFRDLTHRFLFRPLSARVGARWALFWGFVFSGLVHDAVISLPAGGGYGLPTVFFLFQAAGLFFERSRTGRALGLSSGWRGRCFTLAVLALPLYGLFHPPFVRNVIVPFMRAAGA